MIEQNAVIESTMLGIEDHGCLTCWLTLNYGGSGQGFGGYAFDGPREPRGSGREGVAYGTEFIRRLLDTVGVLRWEDLKGAHVRARKESEWGGPVLQIGHIIEDKWFDPKATASEMGLS